MDIRVEVEAVDLNMKPKMQAGGKPSAPFHIGPQVCNGKAAHSFADRAGTRGSQRRRGCALPGMDLSRVRNKSSLKHRISPADNCVL
jgi:hypothetical protein